MSTIQKVCVWVGFDESEEGRSPRSTLLSLFGSAPTQHPRILGYVPSDEFTEILQQWRIPDDQAEDGAAPPTPAQKAMAQIVGRVCRIIAGQEPPTISHFTEKYGTNMGGEEENKPPATVKKIKLSHTLSQTDEQEIPLRSPQKVKDAYANFKNIFGYAPAEKEECTVEQLTGLDNLKSSDTSIYVDFAVWGPFGHRLLKKLKLAGMQMLPGGEFKTVEMVGQPTYYMWEEKHRIFKTGTIILKILKVATA
jgi:hypothetical protein